MSTQRLAAVAAVSHARQYYNRTEQHTYEPHQFNVNVFFASATLCGVVLAVCLACWRRALDSGKPDPLAVDLYSVSALVHSAYQAESLAAAASGHNGPPPAYDAVVIPPDHHKPPEVSLESVVTEPCPRCHAPGVQRTDSGLPTYEAAVLLRDTKL